MPKETYIYYHKPYVPLSHRTDTRAKRRRSPPLSNMRKKVDERIRTLIENGVKTRHRSMFVIIGDKSRDQIVNLHYMLSKADIKSRPTVLWCYKEKLELSSHKRKRTKQVKKLMQRGLLDPEKVDAFSLFLESRDVSYCFYGESDRILGNTYGMCVLQDFEALTPNILARTIETVEGGGLVVLLLRSLSSLSSLCTMVMDIHERFRTESHSEIVPRFNERFLLSLASCTACLVVDDELNILPISSHVKSTTVSSIIEGCDSQPGADQELLHLKEQLHDVFPVGPLVGMCTTFDQGKAVSTFLDAVLDKKPHSTTALIAPRGRGKSAALGLGIAGAIASGYSNIFVTAPTPQNLKSLFEFICRGLHVLKYEEHLHYDLLRTSNPDYQKAITQINLFKQHRQTVQYIEPHDHVKLSQVELLVIDEAAAIPLPIVRTLLGPYLVFLSSTVNGYEGTGRSLSLKLLSHLEKQSQIKVSSTNDSHNVGFFQKLELKESIRYASGDPIETWLNSLLCLDITNSIPPISRFPHPSECNLYYVNRDTLFSFHRESEAFLQRMVALYVASHYKNSPNDLQLMADAPAHHLFVLLGPVDESKNILPDILCVIQGMMKIEREQVLSVFRKIMTKIYKHLYDVLTKDFVSSFPQEREVSLMPHSISVEDDLDDGAKQVMEKMKVDNAGLLKLESLKRYCIADREVGFEQALRTCTTISPSGLISVKSNSSKKEKVGKNSKTAESKKRKRKSNL